ncbi:MAG: iron-sulfur cluster assembly protein IscA [Halofilum sp. (in: g-proteobacteria)]
MSITLTEAAADRVQSFLAKRGRGVGVRLGIRKTGCSGYAYVVDFADEIGESDEVFDGGDVKVIVERSHLPYLDGTQLDFAREGLNETFVFHNPNVKDECGCGESFTV